jgi:TPP-dependent 2-oxoacid decarboxylase
MIRYGWEYKQLPLGFNKKKRLRRELLEVRENKDNHQEHLAHQEHQEKHKIARIEVWAVPLEA